MKKFWNKARLSDKVLAGLLVMVIIGWSATTIYANIINENTMIQPEEVQPEEVEIQAPDMITAFQAREIAVDLVGGGVAQGLNLNTDEGIPTFDIIVYYDDQEFQVILDATNGVLVRLESLTVSPVEVAHLSEDLTAEEAIELAREHLAAIGITNATLVYSYSDIENGVSVWSIEFRYNGRDLEFYVARATGDLLKYPTAINNNSNNGNDASTAEAVMLAPNPVPSPEPSPTPAPAPTPAATTASTETISRERAGEIALNVSGGRLVEVSRDSWHGHPAWWVETRANGRVHEFYICMETGSILEHECEIDD